MRCKTREASFGKLDKGSAYSNIATAMPEYGRE